VSRRLSQIHSAAGPSGNNRSIDKEVPTPFFQVRLWDQDDLIDALLANYEKLGEDLRTDIPLKHIWTVAEVDDEV